MALRMRIQSQPGQRINKLKKNKKKIQTEPGDSILGCGSVFEKAGEHQTDRYRYRYRRVGIEWGSVFL
jgi:hypothetical protein